MANVSGASERQPLLPHTAERRKPKSSMESMGGRVSRALSGAAESVASKVADLGSSIASAARSTRSGLTSAGRSLSEHVIGPLMRDPRTTTGIEMTHAAAHVGVNLSSSEESIAGAVDIITSGSDVDIGTVDISGGDADIALSAGIGHALGVAVAIEEMAQARLQGSRPRFIEKASEVTTGIVQTGAEVVKTAIKIIQSTSSTGSIFANVSTIVGKVGISGMIVAFAIGAVMSLMKLTSVRSSVKSYLSDIGNKTPNEKIQAFNELSGRLQATSEDRKTLLEQILDSKEPWHKKSTTGVVAEKYFPDDTSNSKRDIEDLLGYRADTHSFENIEPNKVTRVSRALGDTVNLDLSVEERADFNAAIESRFGPDHPYLRPQHPLHKDFMKILIVLYKTGLENEAEKREADFQGAFGKDVLKDVKAFKGQAIDLEDPEQMEKVTEILTSASKNLTSGIYKSAFILTGAIIGGIGLVAAYFFSGGAFAYIEVAITAVVAAVSLGVGIYKAWPVFTSNISKKNKAILLLSITGSAVLTGVTLGLSNVKLGMAATVAITTGWILLGVYSIYTWYKTHHAPQIAVPVVVPHGQAVHGAADSGLGASQDTDAAHPIVSNASDAEED